MWLIALRNLLRNRRRSLATLLTLAIGAASILLFGGYSTNIKYSMLTAYVRNGGHLQIQHKDYFLYGSGNPTAYGIRDHTELIKTIQTDSVLRPLVNIVSPTLAFGAIAGHYDAAVSKTVVGIGYVARDINLMRAWNEHGLRLLSRRFELEGASKDAAVVGVGVARVLLLCRQLKVPNCPEPEADDSSSRGADLPQDVALLVRQSTEADVTGGGSTSNARKARIELLAGHGRGAPNVAALDVLSAENQGFKELDDVAVFLHLNHAQALVFGRTEPRATAIMVQLKRTTDAPIAHARLREIIENLATKQPLVVRDLEELNPFFVQTMQLFDMIFSFIFSLIGGIVVFTVGNAMNAAVVERTTEIGTLRAIGLRQSGLRWQFVAEGLLLGVAGALLGVAASLGLSGMVNALELTWLPPGSSDPLPLSVLIWGEFKMLVGTTTGLIAVAALSAWWPAWQAAKLKIVDALRHA